MRWLTSRFRSFGPLRYARITVDKATGRSRGTGFVCFWNVEHADAAIEEAQKVASETGANAMPVSRDELYPREPRTQLGGSSNPFALPSVLTADPSSSLASRLVIHGRTLEVTRAVTREDAGRMKEDSERARMAGDKRNTYLMREGGMYRALTSLSELLTHSRVPQLACGGRAARSRGREATVVVQRPTSPSSIQPFSIHLQDASLHPSAPAVRHRPGSQTLSNSRCA